MENWVSVLIMTLGAGGVGGVLASLLNQWLVHKQEKYIMLRKEKRAVYSKILPKILSSYTKDRKIGENNKIQIDKICAELYLLASDEVYKMVKYFNGLVELEDKEYENIKRQFLGKKLLRYPFSTKSWAEISEEINLLKEKIKNEMRKDLFN